MKIVRKAFTNLSETEKAEIDQFIEFHNGMIFHETKLNEIISQTFKTFFSYFLAYEKGKLVGICPIQSTKSGVLNILYSNNGCFEIPYGGWVFDDVHTSFQRLWDKTAINLFESFIYYSSFFCDIPEKIKNKSNKLLTGLVDLKISEDDIFKNVFSANTRNKIKKAEKLGVMIKNHEIEGLPIFYELLKEMKKKAGLEEKPFAYYEKILNAYLPMQAKIFVAYLKERPLTGVVMIGNKNVMHYWLGASVGEAPNLGQGSLLQWAAIRWAKNSGTKHYDLCVIEPERLPHIAQFKSGFTNKLVSFYCLSKKTLSFRVANKIQNAIKN